MSQFLDSKENKKNKERNASFLFFFCNNQGDNSTNNVDLTDAKSNFSTCENKKLPIYVIELSVKS